MILDIQTVVAAQIIEGIHRSHLIAGPDRAVEREKKQRITPCANMTCVTYP